MSTTDADKQWIDDFVTELRLHGVNGTAIGDALATATSYATESAESLTDAFGDPRTYARELRFRPDQMDTNTLRSWMPIIAPMACGILAVAIGPETARAAKLNSDVIVTWGHLTGFSLLALLILATAALTQPLRIIIEHPILATLVLSGFFAGIAALMVILNNPAFDIPIAIAAVLTVAMLVTQITLELRNRTAVADPVINPLTNKDHFDDGTPSARRINHALRLQPWIYTLATAALVALNWATA
ncbi:hypothetical protein [Dermatophilus congolensis]|uniref:Uncharacterized protein n=1 Tax=Dermatophilus congolensis TaxID=1863 RepID=A0A239VTG9_9MICO|nr:hypothetical protein [Dermatophilus congolensis]MBO3129884.1 hypothetical protein [Dermatophilus congolensis]MBO3131486.1 hypothetical protein [Dermatophilus congolensis]MBO3134358.1 hypothetical protein [Dermatophilus congolensis]MBO3136593.1 hypothetical protein [Dermatophilus congolensis]MBO3138837.1 hypothetical protein [Dermatophilus congolensis]